MTRAKTDSERIGTERSFRPAEVAERCGVTVDTLRYYEKEGLLPDIERDSSGQRVYSEDDVAWIEVLRCLRVTAMPIREMRAFVELVREGDSAIPKRLELLRDHRVAVERQITELQAALAMVDHKIDVYSRTLSETPRAKTNGVTSSPTLDGKGVRAS